MGESVMHVPVCKVDLHAPGVPPLTLVVYGVKCARDITEDMQQAYYVMVGNNPTPRSDLTPEQKSLVVDYLVAQWPEHALI